MEFNNRRLKLFWMGTLFIKIIYAYIAFKDGTYTNQIHPNALNLEIIFLLIGVFSTFIAVWLFRNIRNNNKRILKIINRMKTEAEDKNFSVYVIILGLIETTSLYGMIGYMMVGDIKLIVSLFSIAILGWLLVYPGSFSNSTKDFTKP
ncbi:MAG: hypothetical protein KAR21_11680 [Spirochaetales bacterium]|nr:hypothetical protein [Spirochaetales bacterium]